MKNGWKNSGMTLVELIVVIVIIGIIAVPISTVLTRNYIAYYQDTAKIQASYDMRHAMHQVLNELRSADQNNITLIGENRVDFTVYTTEGSYNAYVRYDSAAGAIKSNLSGSDTTILKRVTEAKFFIVDDYFTLRVTTQTPMPFEEPYILQRSYDYKLRR